MHLIIFACTFCQIHCIFTCIFITAGSKDHVKAQGEILEGLVARLVNHESSKQIEKILKEFPPPPADGGMLIDSLNTMF